MGARVELRGDFSAQDLRALACQAKDSRQSRRLLALAAVAELGFDASPDRPDLYAAIDDKAERSFAACRRVAMRKLLAA